MFGLSPIELGMIVVAALVVFGPKRLPELAKGLGKGIRDFKKALEDRDEEPQEKLPPASTPGTVSRDSAPDSEKKSS